MRKGSHTRDAVIVWSKCLLANLFLPSHPSHSTNCMVSPAPSLSDHPLPLPHPLSSILSSSPSPPCCYKAFPEALPVFLQ